MKAVGSRGGEISSASESRDRNGGCGQKLLKPLKTEHSTFSVCRDYCVFTKTLFFYTRRILLKLSQILRVNFYSVFSDTRGYFSWVIEK